MASIQTINDLLTELNVMMMSHLEYHLLRGRTARDRILIMEDWSEGHLFYADFYQLLPERDQPGVQILQSQVAELLAPISAFVPYLASRFVSPLLKQELTTLCK